MTHQTQAKINPKIFTADFVRSLKSYEIFSSEFFLFPSGIVFVLDSEDNFLYVGFVPPPPKSKIRKAEALLTSAEGRSAKGMCKHLKINRLYIFECSRKVSQKLQDDIKSYLRPRFCKSNSKVKEQKTANCKLAKFSLISKEKILDKFEISGMLNIPVGSYYGFIDFKRFSKEHLESFGIAFRSGTYVNLLICKRKTQSNPRLERRLFPDGYEIIQRLDPDLRNLSDMRLKPAWRRLPWLIPAIDAIYAERDEMTRKTGIPYEVDHIMPIKSHLCCGLTVPWNLQVISAVENRRKSNKVQV